MNANSDSTAYVFNTSLCLPQHGVDSEKPLPYSHIDIAGSSGPFPGVPTGSPILAMVSSYILGQD